MEKKEMITELKNKLMCLRERDFNDLNSFELKAILYIKKIFGKNSEYLDLIKGVSFSPMIFTLDDNEDEKYEREAWANGKAQMINIIETMEADIELNSEQGGTENQKRTCGNKIFIVHGHDNEMKLNVARTLERLDIHPVILHEQPDLGRSVLVKLIEESRDACFAIVLLSPDDYGYSVNETDKHRKARARQNVILELGYFIGVLGSDKVLALYRQDNEFELPSDYVGTLYKNYDPNGAWIVELGKELKAAGIPVDMNKIF